MDPSEMISTARRRAGLSLAKLAERAGTSPATLHAYERGRVAPRLDTLQRVLDAAGMRLEMKLRPSYPEAERTWEFEQALEIAAAFPYPKKSPMTHAIFPERRP